MISVNKERYSLQRTIPLQFISPPAPPAPSIPRTAAPTAFHSPLSARLSPPGTARRVVTKYPRKPGWKVLGYLCPENRVRTHWNPGLSAGPNRNAPARGLSVSSSCAPGSCGGPSSQTAFSSTGASGRTFSRK